MDVTIEIAGYRLHFFRARVEHDDHSAEPYRLILAGEMPERAAGAPLPNELRFSKIERPDGGAFQLDPALPNNGRIPQTYGWIGPLEPGSSRLQAMIVIDVTAANHIDLLPGRYGVELDGVIVLVSGPWELSFSLSGQ